MSGTTVWKHIIPGLVPRTSQAFKGAHKKIDSLHATLRSMKPSGCVAIHHANSNTMEILHKDTIEISFL